MRRRPTSIGASRRPVTSATGAATTWGTVFATSAPTRYATYDGDGMVASGAAAARRAHRATVGGALCAPPALRPRDTLGRSRAEVSRPEEARERRKVRRLAPHLHEPVVRGDRHQHDHDPQHRHEDVERHADPEEHHALGALHDPAARVVAE